jgi:hypothetical protein
MKNTIVYNVKADDANQALLEIYFTDSGYAKTAKASPNCITRSLAWGQTIGAIRKKQALCERIKKEGFINEGRSVNHDGLAAIVESEGITWQKRRGYGVLSIPVEGA